MSTSYFIDRVSGVLGLTPAAVTSTSAVPSAVVDRKGFQTAFIAVDSGISAGNGLTLTLFEGSVAGTAATAVTLQALPAVISTTAAAYTVYQVNLEGFNRYIKAVITPSTATSVTFGINFIFADSNNDPALGIGNAVTPLSK